MTRRVTLVVLCLVSLALGACRKVVVDRNFGRVDGQKSITTNSDSAWKVDKEPAPAPGP